VVAAAVAGDADHRGPDRNGDRTTMTASRQRCAFST
jgi:hypothetical protein